MRLVPVAAAAWAASFWATSGPRLIAQATAGAFLTVIVLWCLRARRWRIVVAAVVGGAFLIAGSMRCAAVMTSPLAHLASDRATVQLDLTVTQEPREVAASGVKPAAMVVGGTVTRIDGRARAWRLEGPVTVVVAADSLTAWREVRVGESVRVIARLESARPADGVAAVARVRQDPVVVHGQHPVLLVAERVRQGLRDAVAQEPPDRAAVLPALVLGDTSHIDPELQRDFKVTALTHLSAVSGANLALLLSFVQLVARAVGVRGWPLRVLAAVTVIAFVVLCRAEPSVMRAAAMGLVTVAALGGGSRDHAGLRHLCVATCALLALDPWLSRSWGFALSVAACVGITVWARPWASALSTWAPAWLAEALAVSLSAQLATQPLVTALAGSVSLVGLPANLVAAVCVGPATVLGLIAAVTAPVFLPLAKPIAAAGAWCAQAIIWVARTGARLPGANLEWPSSVFGLGLLVAATLLLALTAPWWLRRRWWALALALGMVVTILRGPVSPGWPPDRWDLVNCDVGQGDALVARVANHVGVVVDTGPDPTVMARCLDSLGITQIPLAVLTHDHADHVGGLRGMLSGRTVGTVLESPLATASRRRIEADLISGGAAPRVTRSGDSYEVGRIHWTTVSAGGGWQRLAAGEGESSDENDSSIVGMLDVAGLRVLVTGDVEPGGQEAALSAAPSLSCEVLKIPHHGSARQSPVFLAATHATVALISVGAKNDYGHPAAKTTGELRSLGMTIVRTDERGAIAVYRDHGEVKVTTQHEPRPGATPRQRPRR